MKKIIGVLALCMLCLTSCSDDILSEDAANTTEKPSITYSIGDKVELGGVKFNVYKVKEKKNEIYLMARKSIATTAFAYEDTDYKVENNYEGSLVQAYVDEFVDSLEDKGICVKSSGIIDKDDLYDLGFKHSDSLSGLPYIIKKVPKFVKSEENYWLSGYCKYETRAWVYNYESIDTESCNDEYGVRPVIVVEPSEIDKPLQEVDENMDIKEIVNSECEWVSEGGISNPYDHYYFDCNKLLFINKFESPERNETNEYNMEFVDEKTILSEGLRYGYNIPVKITVVNTEKLRVRFLDNDYNDEDYFLVRKK